MRKNQIIALMFCIVLSISMTFSITFIVQESNHDCIGDGCATCCVINICQSLIDNLKLAKGSIIITLALFDFYILILLNKKQTFTFNSLSSLKVKLTI